MRAEELEVSEPVDEAIEEMKKFIGEYNKAHEELKKLKEEELVEKVYSEV